METNGEEGQRRVFKFLLLSFPICVTKLPFLVNHSGSSVAAVGRLPWKLVEPTGTAVGFTAWLSASQLKAFRLLCRESVFLSSCSILLLWTLSLNETF